MACLLSLDERDFSSSSAEKTERVYTRWLITVIGRMKEKNTHTPELLDIYIIKPRTRVRMPRRHVKRENSSEDRSRSILSLSLSLRRCSSLGIEAKERKSGNITEREEQNDGTRARETISRDPSRVFLSIKTVSNHVVSRTNCKRQSRSISVLFPRTREKTTMTTTASPAPATAIRDSSRVNTLCQTMTNTRHDRSDLFRAADPRHSSLLTFNISPTMPKITLIAAGPKKENHRPHSLQGDIPPILVN